MYKLKQDYNIQQLQPSNFIYVGRNLNIYWALKFCWLNKWTHAVYEIFERMAYYGISSNLILYLTKKLHQGTVTASNNVTNWVGTIWITPILGAYVADAHLGRYWTFVIASTIYISVSTITFFSFLPSLFLIDRF